MEQAFWMLMGAIALLVAEVAACVWSQRKHDRIMRKIAEEYWNE